MKGRTTLLALLFAPVATLAQIQVVGDDACPKYAVDIAAFATCDGDRIATPAAATLRIAALPEAAVPAHKRSDSGRHVSAAEAYRLRQEYPGQVALIDIRSRIEAIYFGQPDGVDVHVPFREPVLPQRSNPARGRLELQRNPTFVDDVKAELALLDWPEDSILLLLCRSGELSAIAADALAAAGLHRVFTIVDGFEGDVGESGRRDVNGWKNAVGHWRILSVARLGPAARP